LVIHFGESGRAYNGDVQPQGVYRDPEWWRDSVRELRKVFVSPQVAVWLAVVLTTEYWIGAAIYVCLASFLVAPSGLIAWAVLALLGGASVVGFVSPMYATLKHAPALRAARRSVIAGDPESEARYKDARLEFRSKVKGRHLMLGFIALQLTMPPAVALALRSEMQTPTMAIEHGQAVVHTPADQVRSKMRALKERGLFTPLNRN
jgi:hypothetical protein